MLIKVNTTTLSFKSVSMLVDKKSCAELGVEVFPSKKLRVFFFPLAVVIKIKHRVQITLYTS